MCAIPQGQISCRRVKAITAVHSTDFTLRLSRLPYRGISVYSLVLGCVLSLCLTSGNTAVCLEHPLGNPWPFSFSCSPFSPPMITCLCNVHHCPLFELFSSVMSNPQHCSPLSSSLHHNDRRNLPVIYFIFIYTFIYICYVCSYLCAHQKRALEFMVLRL